MNIEQNKKTWENYPWDKDGDEWSKHWGSTANLWEFTIAPRIQPLLFSSPPDGPVLEIACGHGRMTEWLLKLPISYIGIDLMGSCIDHCRKRFGESLSHKFHQCNGKSLEMIERNSVAFAFSWGSLVHCDKEVMEAYADELDRTLMNGGYAFLHHSNLGSLVGYDSVSSNLESITTRRLRDPTVSAKSFANYCHKKTGLQVRLQEKVGWAFDGFIDCITVLRKGGARGQIEIEPRDFMEEAKVVCDMVKIRKHYNGAA